MPATLPTVLRRLSNDEYRPLPYGPKERAVVRAWAAGAEGAASRLGLTPDAYALDRRGAAAALREVSESAGGGFYDIPPEAALDDEAAQAAFAPGPGEVVIDVQTHLANPARWYSPIGEVMGQFLEYTDPERWGGGVDPGRLSAAAWATHVFGESDTAVALITSTPGRPQENILANDEIAACRQLVDRFAGTGRVLTHTIVHPNLGPAELERMVAWRDALSPSGWKAYTMWGPPEADPNPAYGDTGYFLDDEAVGIPFLQHVRDLGPRILAVHKGISGPIPDAGLASGSPRDIGPAAAMFPEIDFLVYHSGYEPDPTSEEGPYTEDQAWRGVNRLVATLAEAGIGHGGNVYAELGSTWYLMVRRPREAAHVLGKLLLAVGEDNILWGTDCIWYGSPQPLIDAFRAFTIPEELQATYGYPPLTDAVKAKILGANAARVYGIDLPRAASALREDRSWIRSAAGALADRFPEVPPPS
jgi:predicted TIM-barrel fold metal-dependent hydrolase